MNVTPRSDAEAANGSQAIARLSRRQSLVDHGPGIAETGNGNDPVVPLTSERFTELKTLSHTRSPPRADDAGGSTSESANSSDFIICIDLRACPLGPIEGAPVTTRSTGQVV